jgi:hypothetical protein
MYSLISVAVALCIIVRIFTYLKYLHKKLKIPFVYVSKVKSQCPVEHDTFYDFLKCQLFLSIVFQRSSVPCLITILTLFMVSSKYE